MKKILVVFIIGLTVSAGLLYGEESLRFGVFPMSTPRTLTKIFKPIADSIENSTGMSVRMISAPDTNTFNERAIEGEYDIVWINNSGYINLADKNGFYAVAGGMPDYRGVVMVRADSGIDSVEQLAGRNVVAINRKSIAGYIFFRNMMTDLGFEVQKDYFVDFNKDVEAMPFLVINGRYDALVFSEDTYLTSSFYESTRELLKIVAVSETLPQFPFAVSPTLPNALAEKIQDGVLALTPATEEGRSVLKELKIGWFVQRSDAYYDDFRDFYNGMLNYEKKN